MWTNMDYKHTKGYKHQVSEAGHQESRDNIEVQIGKHWPIRYDRNQLFAINYVSHRIRLNGDAVINVRRLRINKRHRGKGEESDLATNTDESLNLNNLVEVSLQKVVETTIEVILSTMNTQSLRNEEYVVL